MRYFFWSIGFAVVLAVTANAKPAAAGAPQFQLDVHYGELKTFFRVEKTSMGGKLLASDSLGGKGTTLVTAEDFAFLLEKANALHEDKKELHACRRSRVYLVVNDAQGKRRSTMCLLRKGAVSANARDLVDLLATIARS